VGLAPACEEFTQDPVAGLHLSGARNKYLVGPEYIQDRNLDQKVSPISCNQYGIEIPISRRRPPTVEEES
jgi:hypothetical protein